MDRITQGTVLLFITGSLYRGIDVKLVFQPQFLPAHADVPGGGLDAGVGHEFLNGGEADARLILGEWRWRRETYGMSCEQDYCLDIGD